jgi:hypothetical protein
VNYAAQPCNWVCGLNLGLGVPCLLVLTVRGVRGLQDKRHTHREFERDTEGRKKVPGCAAGVGSNRPMPKGRDNPTARGDLFNHLSYAPGGRETDSWVGNHLIGTTAVRSCS